MNRKILSLFVLGLLILIMIGNVLAITAAIGNARMILRPEIGETLEKSILVKNTNNVTVDILLTASGDLKEDITIKDNNFTLEPGAEKKAYFTIEVTKSGTTESKINVQFTPVDGKNGAGLSSTIVVITNGTSLDENTDVTNTGTEDNNSSTTSTKSSVTGKVIGSLDKNMIAFGTTLILALVFIVVLIIYYTRFKKKTIESKEKLEKEKVVKTKLKKKVKKRV